MNTILYKQVPCRGGGGGNWFTYCLSMGGSRLEFSFQNRRSVFYQIAAQDLIWAHNRLFETLIALMLELSNILATSLCGSHNNSCLSIIKALPGICQTKMLYFSVVTSCGMNDSLYIWKVVLEGCCLRLSFGVLGSELFLKFIVHFDLTTLLGWPFWHPSAWEWQK